MEKLSNLQLPQCLNSLLYLYLDIDVRDHCFKVARYAGALAFALESNELYVSHVFVAALLHDIGKIKIPKKILNKPGKLTAQEWELIKQHPRFGSDIISNDPFLSQFSDSILYHHEYFDGRGYPHGLKGKDIPEIARIICIADSFDAMTSNRPYKGKISIRSALQEITDLSNKQFDPDLVNLFINLF